MDFNLQTIKPEAQGVFSHYASLRPSFITEAHFLNQFIWADFYRTEYCITDQFLFIQATVKNKTCAMMPFCRDRDIPETFFTIQDYFHNQLGQKMNMYLVDEPMATALCQIPGVLDNYDVEEERNCFDYVYDADKLRTLSGKAYHKKKNHVNGFLKTYEGHFQYETLNCSHVDEIIECHNTWLDERKTEYRPNLISSEESGILRLFEHCGLLDCHIGGIRMDGKLEAYSIGSYDENLKCAFIHVEKANHEVRGLYNYINQQFLSNEFPEASYVNREDDLGQEGLRKAKLSYRPIRLEKKFSFLHK